MEGDCKNNFWVKKVKLFRSDPLIQPIHFLLDNAQFVHGVQVRIQIGHGGEQIGVFAEQPLPQIWLVEDWALLVNHQFDY